MTSIIEVDTPSLRSKLRLEKPLDDEQLAARVGLGDEAAFSAIHARYSGPLSGYCRSIVENECDAQDALQSAWVKALVALGRGQRDAPLQPWLFRICHNEAVSLLRRRRAATALDPEAAGAESAEQTVIDRERFARLIADLQTLPARSRGALVMRELGGLSHEEIATSLQTSVGSAKQSILEARRGLAEFAAGRETACETIATIISEGDRRVLRGRRVRGHLDDCAACAAFAESITEPGRAKGPAGRRARWRGRRRHGG